jgi:tetratricopeptide (TPR) repeat protein
MKPLINSTEQYWYAGNNHFSGEPGSGAIVFQENSYPEMDSGYNVNAITGGLFLKGDIPAFLNGSLYVTLNKWGNGGVPAYTKYDVVGGDIYFEPLYDGSGLSRMESFETNDIAFNLLDTVYINDLGDSPGKDLFIEANHAEMQGQYSTAITKYKNIILNYKNDYIALASLSRVFNCLDKARSTNSEYSAHQTYLTQIKNNSQYPLAVRELCEDFIIKTKVRLGQLQDAISDYTSIYNQNQNNAKGFHALLNKECLLARLDTTDAPGTSFNDLSKHKIALLGLLGVRTVNPVISHKNIPDKYELSQNYPNPFNPTTNIKYGIPKQGMVTIKIYDLLGREIKTLVNEIKNAGSYIVTFNGSEFASGVYFYRIQTKDFVQVKRMVLIK